jgi:hypothetical protein
MGALVDLPRTTAGTGRELAWVLAVACLGLLLAVLVAFSPWYPRAVGGEPEPSPATGSTQVVKMRASRTAAPPGCASTGFRSSSRTCGCDRAKSPTATISSTSASRSAAGVPR